MCSIIGYYPKDPSMLLQRQYLIPLIKESKIRGLHAFGIAYWSGNGVVVQKFPTVEVLIEYVGDVLMEDGIFHSRYCTSGDWREMENNQPISYDNYHLVFNGVISMKTKQEMEKDYGVKLNSDNDGELFLHHVINGGNPLYFVNNMKGSFAGLWYDNEGVMYALRNDRRPMWIVTHEQFIMLASTFDIITRAFSTVDVVAKECSPGTLYVPQEML